MPQLDPTTMLESIPTIVLAGIAITIGIAGLVWSADRFVAGAASIAESFGIAPMIVGLTIVSFGTSAPEVMVSLIAAFDGSGELAIGNAIGSNIANVGLVLGVTLLIASIPVDNKLLKHEGIVLVAVTLLAGFFLYNSHISVTEGAILLALLIPAIWYLAYIKQKDHRPEELIDDSVEHYQPKIAVFWFIFGLLLLVVSSKVLVWGAVTTAEYFNVSPLIIGLSIVAIGTSLPELAASVMSALKGHHDIAVGNIIGSNIFNLLAVMSLPGIVGGQLVSEAVFARDYLAMLIVTVGILGLVAVAILRQGPKAMLGRISGIGLLIFYIGYMVLIGKDQLSA